MHCLILSVLLTEVTRWLLEGWGGHCRRWSRKLGLSQICSNLSFIKPYNLHYAGLCICRPTT